MVSPNLDSHRFNLQDYYNHPENYRSQFEKYVPFLSLIVNGIYWEPKYPRLITKRFLRALFEADSQPALRVIGDITCDIEGSVECTLKSTNAENPVYVYHPFTENIDDGIQGKGVVVMAVDKLPSELPFEASVSFGESLSPFVPTLATADFTDEFRHLHIPAEFKGAVIAHHGRLTPNFKYLKQFIK
jgi:alpha-aminoadipic semialdehyde synthase